MESLADQCCRLARRAFWRDRPDSTPAKPSADRLLRVVDTARLALWSWDFEREAFEWSPRCLELFGAPPDTAVSREVWLDHVHPQERARVQQAVRRAIQNREEFHCDYRVVWPDGSIHWLTSVAVPVYSSRGKALRLDGFMREITPRKAAEAQAAERDREVRELHEALARRAVEAETAVRAKEAFLQTVSHELRTPLNHIMGGVDVLASQPRLPEQAPWLEMIVAGSRQLLEMVEHVLSVTENAAGARAVQRRVFSPGVVLKGAVTAALSRVRQDRLEVQTRLDWALPEHLVGDPTLLTQALLNYLHNALKVAPAGSTVLVSAAIEESTDVLLRVRFEVADSGPGIPEELRQGIFQQLNCDTLAPERRQGGLGLGLASTKACVTAMGGEVGFESAPGGGSRFWFVVPLERCDQAA